MRTLPGFITLALVSALALTGCTAAEPDAEATSSGLSCTAPGTKSDSVEVSGEEGVKPTVTFATPMTAETTERTVITEGTDDAVEIGDAVEIAYTAYNATTGAELTGGGYGDDPGLPVTVSEGQNMIPGLLQGIVCANVGSRIAMVVPPVDAFGEAGNETLGVAATDSIIFVIDVKSKVPTRATGVDQEPQDGLPTVKLADDGAPTITIPDTDAPAELQIGVLKKGDGAVVADGATVTVQYAGVVWATGEVFDQSWGKSGPTAFSTSQVVKGFGQGLVGQTEGSQVVIVIPPELGYGPEGNPNAGISGTDTIVFVVDILATA